MQSVVFSSGKNLKHLGEKKSYDATYKIVINNKKSLALRKYYQQVSGTNGR